MKDFLNFHIQGKNRICNVWLYPEDNLEIKDSNVDQFDIIICDGPYGILEPSCDWDNYDLSDKQGREQYRSYYRKLFDVCLGCLKDSGSMFVFNYPEGASIIKGVLDEEYDMCFRRWISWIYDNHHDFDEGTNFKRSHETVLYYTRKSDGFVFHEGKASDVLSHPIIKIESSAFKDGAKPLDVMGYLLDMTYTPGGRLLSLFAGSGTDIIAAAEHDMDVMAFESNRDNFSMLVETIDN